MELTTTTRVNTQGEISQVWKNSGGGPFVRVKLNKQLCRVQLNTEGKDWTGL